jgi:hypothetical protein
MGFKDVRDKVATALKAGNYGIEPRRTTTADGGNANLLQNGEITAEEVVELLYKYCSGTQYETSRHHQLSCDVHIFKPVRRGQRWYIKTYFLSEITTLQDEQADVIIISVHPSATQSDG